MTQDGPDTSRAITFVRSAVVALCLSLSVLGTARAETVIIDDVYVEVRAKSAVIAKASAIAKAETEARIELGRDLYIDLDPRTDFANLDSRSTVKYFRIRNEKSGPGYYSATFQFAFETAFLPDTETEFTSQSGTVAPEGFGDWVLAIPIHYVDGNDKPNIWDPTDAWTRFWIMPRIGRRLPVIANVADDEDRELLGEHGDGDLASLLKTLANKYGALSAAFVTLDQSMDPYANGFEPGTSRVSVDYWHPSFGLLGAASNISDVDLSEAKLSEAAGNTAMRILRLLMSGNLPSPVLSPGFISIPIQMEISRSEQWQNSEASLNSIKGAELTNVRINGNQVEAEILYSGTYKDLITEIARLGLLLPENQPALQR